MCTCTSRSRVGIEEYYCEYYIQFTKSCKITTRYNFNTINVGKQIMSTFGVGILHYIFLSVCLFFLSLKYFKKDKKSKYNITL